LWEIKMKRGSGRRRFLIGSVALGLLVAAGLATAFYFKKSGGQAGGDAAGTARDGTVATASNKGQGTGSAAGAKDNVKGDAKEKAPVPVSVAPVGLGTVSSYISSTANLVPEDEVKVLAEAEGRVAELLVEEGDRVGRGQILAQLVKDDAEIAFKKAQLKTANARMAYERASKVISDNLMSREAFDKVGFENEVAQQELAEAQWRLDKTTIRAPFGGRITDRVIKPGQHVRPGDVLFTVSDFDPLIARIYLPEKDVFGLKAGREVRITLKANEETRFSGRIRQISPVVDPGTGTVKVTIEAAERPADVRPGSFVTIDIVREVHARALLLPREAVVRELQDSYVFVARDDVARKKPVSLGLEEGTHIEALSGVAAGDQVIVAGQGGLREGTPIKIIPAREASDMSLALGQPPRG
jgi:membrane fusion protein (multidrug efflux system)